MASNKSAKKVIKKFAKESSTHGIRFIVLEKSKLVRTAWLILLLVATGFFIYEMQKLLKAYYNRSVLISIKKKEVKEMTFPSVTICKSSTLSRSGGVQEHTSLRQAALKHYYLTQYHLMAYRGFLAQDYFRNWHTLEEVRRATGDPRNLFLSNFESSCIFGIHEYCSYPRNISDIITSSYGGMCYQFNKNGKAKQRDAASYYGLTMILFVNQSDYVPFSTFDFGSGILLKIHDAGEYPFPDINGLLISTGFLTRIALKKVVSQRLKSPFPSNCTDGKNINILYPGKYTSINCKRSCIVRDSLKSCGSSDPLTMMLLNETGKSKYKPISKATQDCVFNAAAKSTSKDRNECTCPLPCSEVEYIPTISQTKWPSSADLPFYKYMFSHALGLRLSQLTDDFVYKNFLQLNIYFDEMSYEEVLEKEEWTTEKLISDIGGQMGVWIGASFLSLFEIASFLVCLFKILCLKYKERKKSKITKEPKHALCIKSPKIKPMKQTISLDNIIASN